MYRCRFRITREELLRISQALPYNSCEYRKSTSVTDPLFRKPALLPSYLIQLVLSITKEAFTHGAVRFIPIPGATGRSITAKVWLQAGTTAFAGLPLQLRGRFLLHFCLHRHIFPLCARPGGWRPGLFLDMANCRHWAVPCSAQLR